MTNVKKVVKFISEESHKAGRTDPRSFRNCEIPRRNKGAILRRL